MILCGSLRNTQSSNRLRSSYVCLGGLFSPTDSPLPTEPQCVLITLGESGRKQRRIACSTVVGGRQAGFVYSKNGCWKTERERRVGKRVSFPLPSSSHHRVCVYTDNSQLCRRLRCVSLSFQPPNFCLQVSFLPLGLRACS